MVVTFGAIKRGNWEIIVEAKDGVVQIPRSIEPDTGSGWRLWQKAGASLEWWTDISADILAIKVLSLFREYVVNEIQEVYRLQV